MSESEELGEFFRGMLTARPKLVETCRYRDGPGLLLAQHKEKGQLDVSPVR